MELTSALHFYLCVGISSPLSQMKRSESFPDHVLFFVTHTFPKLLPVPDEVHDAGFLVQSWFLNYSHYYSMLYFRMTNMTIYENFYHNTSKGIPFVLVTINTLHSVHCSAFLLSVALLWASPLGDCFNKQAIGKSLLCPNCFLSVFCCIIFLTKSNLFFFLLFFWTRSTSSRVKEITNQLIN